MSDPAALPATLLPTLAAALEALAPGAQRLLVAVSGGGDSVALLRLLVAVREATPGTPRLAVAHFDHRLRPDSAADATFVEALAAELGLPFRLGSAPVARVAAARGWNEEDAARRLRYRFLARSAKELRADLIVLAHTRDDQAETVLLQLLRGAAALRGMAPRRGRLVRPLLWPPLRTLGRTELRAWLDAAGHPYRRDPTNDDPARARAWLRREVLPRLDARAPGVAARLARHAELQRDLEAFVAVEAERRFAPARGWLAAPALAAAPPALQRQALAALLRASGAAVDAALLEAARAAVARYAAPPGTPQTTPGATPAERAGQPTGQPTGQPAGQPAGESTGATAQGSARESPDAADGAPAPWRRTLDPERTLRLVNGRLDVVRTPDATPAVLPEHRLERPEQLPEGVPAALAELLRAGRPLTLRGRRPGDRIRLPGGRRKLSDLLIDRKVPREARDRLRLVADGAEVLWVEGVASAAGLAAAHEIADPERRWMGRALELAARAADAGELPVGAVVLRAGEVLAEAHNETEARRDPTAHAELLALRRAAAALGDWRLSGCTLVVTLEPCAMCYGAALQAHLARLVYGAPNRREGALGSVADLGAAPWKRTVAVRGGVRAGEAARLLRRFFAARRGPTG